MHYVQMLQSRLAVGFAAGVCLVPAFAVVDWAYAPGYFGFFLVLRLAAAVLLGAMWFLNRMRAAQAWQEGLTVAGALTVAVMLEIMLVSMGGRGSDYYAGLNLVLIAALALIPIRLLVAASLAAAILLIYLLPLAVAHTPMLTYKALLHNAGTLASASLLLLAANWLHRLGLLRQFKLRLKVEEHQAQLAALNASLEQQVARRTADLARSEARYRSLVDSNPQLIYSLDSRGAYTFVGPKAAELMGHQPEGMLGSFFIDYVHPDDHLHCVRAFKDIRDQGLMLGDVEYRVRRADGAERIFLSYTAPLYDEEGQVNGVIGSAVDVTPQRRMAAEREQYRNELNQTLEQLEQAAFEIVQGLAGAVEAKDPYTRGHASRVRQISLAIAQEAGLGREELVQIEYAAELHDVGKIGVRGEVLNKKGALSDEEYEHIKAHPRISEDILRDVGLLAPVRPLIRAHHERFDGKGYPDGLAGEDIPFSARILAVADSFDAMRTNRPYRSMLSEGEALAELEKSAGSQFDPQVVLLFKRACRSGQVPGFGPD